MAFACLVTARSSIAVPPKLATLVGVKLANAKNVRILLTALSALKGTLLLTMRAFLIPSSSKWKLITSSSLITISMFLPTLRGVSVL